MKKAIFEYQDYKSYLKDELKARTKSGRGERTRLAAATQCHTAYVSQVLNGSAHFNLEQAERVSRFLGHNKSEGAFFLTLLQFNRAGTSSLKAHFKEQMAGLTEKQFVLKDRLQFKKTLSVEDQNTFYSSWHYGAIHVLVSVPGCNTERGVSDYLGLPQEVVADALHFLLNVGLVVREGGKYQVGTTHIHLDAGSKMITPHHINWRLQAIRSLETSSAKDLHYSSVITASLEDSVKIKAVFVEAIEKIRAIVKPSRNEAAFSYCLDFFGLGRGDK